MKLLHSSLGVTFHFLLCTIISVIAILLIGTSSASVVIYVPCGQLTIYGPVLALNTTLLLSGCDASPNGTTLNVKFNSSSGARFGLFIVVEHSNRVVVLIQSAPSRVNVTNLNVIFRNITNDVDNRSTPLTSAMFRIADCSIVMNPSVIVSDVRNVRNTSLVRFNYVDGVSGLSLVVANVTSLSTYPVVYFDTITTVIADSSILLSNVTFQSVKSLSFAAMIQVDNIAQPVIAVARTNISVVSCILGGSGVNVFAIVLDGAHVDQHSQIVVAGLQAQVTAANIAGGLIVRNSFVGRTSLRLSNYSCIASKVTTYIVLIQNATLADSTALTMNAVTISRAATTTLGLYVISSSVIASSIALSNVRFSAASSGTALYVIYARYDASLPLPASFINVNVTMSQCQATSAQAIALCMYNVSLFNTYMLMDSIATAATSQYNPIFFSGDASVASNIILSVRNSYLVGAFPIQFSSLDVEDSTIFVTDSTLRTSKSAYYPNVATSALIFYSTDITNTNITVTSTNVIGVPSGANAASSVEFSYSTLERVTAVVVWTSLTTCGSILKSVSSTFTNSSVLRLQVLENITTPSLFPFSLVDTSFVTVSSSSTIQVLLPPQVQMATNGTSLVPLFSLATMTVMDSSVFLISSGAIGDDSGGGGGGALSHMLWTNATLWISNPVVSQGCSITLSNLKVFASVMSVVTITTTTDAPLTGDWSVALALVNSTFEQVNAQRVSSWQFMSLTTSNANGVAHAAAMTAMINITQCSFSTPWAPLFPTSLVRLPQATTNITSLTLYADQLWLYGLRSFIVFDDDDDNHSDSSNNNFTTPPLVVASVTLRCGWWGRHPFTSSLSPIVYAMRGQLLRGPVSAIGPTTHIVNSPVTQVWWSSTKDFPHCGLEEGNQRAGGSWSLTSSSSAKMSATLNHLPFLSTPTRSESIQRSVVKSDTLSMSLEGMVRTTTSVTATVVTRSHSTSRSKKKVNATATVSPQGTLTRSKISPSLSTSFSSSSSLFSSSNVSASSTHTADGSPSVHIQTLRLHSRCLLRGPTAAARRRLAPVVPSATMRQLLATTSASLSVAPQPPSDSMGTSSRHTATLKQSVTPSSSSPSVTHQPTRTYDAVVTPSRSLVVAMVDIALDAPAVLQAAAFIATVGATAGGSAAGEAATIATLTMMTCGGKRTWDSNAGIQRLVVSVFYDLGPGTALLGNIAVALLCYIAQKLVITCAVVGWGSHPAVVSAHIRCPSLSWTLFLLLLPGILFSCVSLFSFEGDDAVFGTPPPALGRSVAAGIAILVTFAVIYRTVTSVAEATRGRVHTKDTSHFLCDPFLPRWFMKLAGSWLLPRVVWEPKDLKLQYGNFFSSVARSDAVWVHPVFQMHGAVFSLIAAIPFPSSACVVQFVLAIAWVCVPVGLLVKWKLSLLRRPPSNPLSCLSNVIIIGVLIATVIFVEGPTSAQSVAASARDALGIVLTIVSVAKMVLSIVSVIAEALAKRRYDRDLKLKRTQIIVEVSSEIEMNAWVSELRHQQEEQHSRGVQELNYSNSNMNSSGSVADPSLAWASSSFLGSSGDAGLMRGASHERSTALKESHYPSKPQSAPLPPLSLENDDAQVTHHHRAASLGALQLSSVLFDADATVDSTTTTSFYGVPRRSLNLSTLDAQIDRVVSRSLYPRSESREQQKRRAQQFTLKLLITRAARKSRAEALES
ncbi:membrane-associated protein, putative [Bodo saltans]|uniref:Membrane-associated protein, putative n=1 Tax=Bodo saltans TaxID=75058 RepID=A0A0S4IVD8_BODSA|nr:membrane-associated protein, putative [Bodo saltans]|eukprot:CUG17608.1 membrane-associated protein, putative [Bodo saltans]